MRDWASELRAIADGRLMLNMRNGVTVSRSMLAMIADEIDALRAAPLTPAEVGGHADAQTEARATAQASLWVPAKPEHAEIGWTFYFEQTERIARAAYDSTGYDAPIEVVEFVMAEADRRHRDALTTERAAKVAELSRTFDLLSLEQQRAERAEQERDEWVERCRTSVVAFDEQKARAERAEAELARRDMQLEASAKVALDLSAQLAEARKALNAGEALSRQLHAVIDRLNGQAYSSTLSALNYFDAARRALEEQGGENG